MDCALSLFIYNTAFGYFTSCLLQKKKEILTSFYMKLVEVVDRYKKNLRKFVKKILSRKIAFFLVLYMDRWDYVI